MKLLMLFLIIPNLALADLGYTTSTEVVYRLSCERTALRMFTKYGAGSQTPPQQEKLAVKYCDDNVVNITAAKAWRNIDSPAGTACMDVVKSLIKVAPHRYPSKEELFGELCYSITRKDG